MQSLYKISLVGVLSHRYCSWVWMKRIHQVVCHICWCCWKMSEKESGTMNSINSIIREFKQATQTSWTVVNRELKQATFLATQTLSVHNLIVSYAPINVNPQRGGVGHMWGIWSSIASPFWLAFWPQFGEIWTEWLLLI
jgi:hypothetical protein